MPYKSNRKRFNPKWKATVALALMLSGMMLNLVWAWGVLFLFWVIMDLINQETHLIEVVKRSKNPILYWSIVVIWLLLSFFSFLPSS